MRNHLAVIHPVPHETPGTPGGSIGYWKFYAMGVLGWLCTAFLLFGWRCLTLGPVIAAHGFCILMLGANLYFQWKAPTPPKTYRLTVLVYEYVERNSYYLIMAISIFLIVSMSGYRNNAHNIRWTLVIYSQAAAVTLCTVILTLIWMPAQDDRRHWLVKLKHFKTIVYIYALSLFLIGPIELIIKLWGSF